MDFGWQVERLFDLPRAKFVDRATRLGYRHLRFGQLAVGEGMTSALDGLGSVELSQSTDAVSMQLIRPSDNTLVLTELRKGTLDFSVAASTRDHLDPTVEAILAAAAVDDEDRSSVPITFWAGSHTGGISSAHRKIEAPTWSEIAPNHARPTRLELDRLMGAGGPDGGHLILWHGPPGTGKTHALKALIREWDSWCIPHFITDPETFLGDESSYLMRVLTGGDPEPRRDRAWRLIVLEDSGELLASDARERTGQALSRMLNVTDGLLGQGLNALVLVTTNEPVRKLHPAVTRPGRCWAEVEFETLSVPTANSWLAAQGLDERVSHPAVIADLYAMREDRKRSPEAPQFGFAPA